MRIAPVSQPHSWAARNDTTNGTLAKSATAPQPNLLHPPREAGQPPVSGSGVVKAYTAVPGDTLARIAHKNHVTLDTLRAANPDARPRRVYAGQVFQIPAADRVTARSRTAYASPPPVRSWHTLDPKPSVHPLVEMEVPKGEKRDLYTSPSDKKYHTIQQHQELKKQFDWDAIGPGDNLTGALFIGWYDAYHFKYVYKDHATRAAINPGVESCKIGDGYKKEIEPRPHNDCRDAIRHAYFSALMAQHSSSDAKQVGDAHERSVLGPYKEIYMDLHNKRVGRKIGSAKENKNKSHAELFALVAQALKNGELITGLDQVPPLPDKK